MKNLGCMCSDSYKALPILGNSVHRKHYREQFASISILFQLLTTYNTNPCQRVYSLYTLCSETTWTEFLISVFFFQSIFIDSQIQKDWSTTTVQSLLLLCFVSHPFVFNFIDICFVTPYHFLFGLWQILF